MPREGEEGVDKMKWEPPEMHAGVLFAATKRERIVLALDSVVSFVFVHCFGFMCNG